MNDGLEKSAYSRIVEALTSEAPEIDEKDLSTLGELQEASASPALDEDVFVFFYTLCLATIKRLLKKGLLESPLTEENTAPVFAQVETATKSMNILKDERNLGNSTLIPGVPFLPWLRPALTRKIFDAACQDAEIDVIREKVAESGLIMETVVKEPELLKLV